MTTVAAGADVPIVWSPGVAYTTPVVTITPVGGSAVVGPTDDGLGIDGTTYSYVWSTTSSTTAGTYTATLSGTVGGTPTSTSSTVYVTAETVYADLADLKTALGITDTTRDTLLSRALSAASRGIDARTGRQAPGFGVDTAATARVYPVRGNVLDDPDGQLLMVDEISTTSGLVVEVGDVTGGWTAVTDYEAEPPNAAVLGVPVTGLRRPLSSWTTRQVRVTALWGWPAVPVQVEQACLLQAGRLYRRKDSPEGVLGSSEWGVVRVSRIDPDVADLLARYLPAGVG